MSAAVDAGAWVPGDVRSLFGAGSPRVLIESAGWSRRADRITCTLAGAPATADRRALEPRTILIPTTASAGRVLDREARLLVELRRRRLGAIEATIPRYVATRQFDGLPVLVASTLPGRPMCARPRTWTPSPPRPQACRDFRAAADWLDRLHDASALDPTSSTWVGEVAQQLQARWPGHPMLGDALDALQRTADRLDGYRLEQTVVHGDFSFQNLLVEEDRISGVTNWSAGSVQGSPLRDPARFVLCYPSRREPLPALVGSRRYRALVQSFLAERLTRVGVPPDRWYELVLAGLGELAATDPDHRRAARHLHSLAQAPIRGR